MKLVIQGVKMLQLINHRRRHLLSDCFPKVINGAKFSNYVSYLFPLTFASRQQPFKVWQTEQYGL